METGGNLPSESGALNRIEPVPWRGVRAVEKIILIALILAVAAVIALPFLDQVILRRLARLSGARPFVTWLVNGYNSWIVAAALLGLTILFVLYVRHRLVANKGLWSGIGCPECKERELVRVSRRTSDRLYRLIGVPAFRYACRNCTWRGLRVARREHSPERIAELEASLARFDPDGLPGIPAIADVSVTESPTADGQSSISGSMFRDSGDVEAAATPRVNPAPKEDAPEVNDIAESADPNLNGEPVESMEWIWRRSSDE